MKLRVLLGTLLLLGGLQARAEKTFVYCSEASPSTFNPQMADDGPTYNAASQMLYNRIVEFEPSGTKVGPGLAERWEISKDGKTYTFFLRKNVWFHTTKNFKPSRPMNADDVVFSFDRGLNKSNPYHKVSGGNYPFFLHLELAKLIRKIEKVDDYTVKFHLTRPESPFLANLATDFAVVLSKEYADQLQAAKKMELIDIDPVGSGPFVLIRYVKDNSIRYKAHDQYWRGRAKLDQVVFAITPDANVRYQKLKAGECHLIAEPSPQDIQSMRANKAVQLMQKPGANVGYLALNTQKEPFNKLEVRQAIAHALNRESYIKVVYNDTAQLASHPLPPTVWGAGKQKNSFEYNVEKARALLEQAGYPNGFSAELWTLPVSRPYNPNGKKMGELMQADLAKVGIKVKLVTYDWPTYLDKSRKGEHQMIQLGWTTDNGDPDSFLATLLSCGAIQGGSNVSRWCHEPYTELVEEARQISSIEKRARIYQEAIKIFAQQKPWVPIAHSTVFRGLSPKVKGYEISPFGVEDFYPLDIK